VPQLQHRYSTNASRLKHKNLNQKVRKKKERKDTQLENEAIANALQFEAARRHARNSRFNYNAMPRLKSLNLSIAAVL